MSEIRCFECGNPATDRHHVVPQSLGGTKTVPLCEVCHQAVHSPGEPISLGKLNQLARKRRKIKWRCERCDELVDDGAGYIAVVQDEIRAYEEAEAAWDAKYKSGPDELRLLAWSEAAQFPEKIGWHVTHDACEPILDRSGYGIGVEQVRDVGQLLEWTAHLLDKEWFPNTDWNRLLERIARELT